MEELLDVKLIELQILRYEKCFEQFLLNTKGCGISKLDISNFSDLVSKNFYFLRPDSRILRELKDQNEAILDRVIGVKFYFMADYVLDPHDDSQPTDPNTVTSVTKLNGAETGINSMI